MAAARCCIADLRGFIRRLSKGSFFLGGVGDIYRQNLPIFGSLGLNYPHKFDTISRKACIQSEENGDTVLPRRRLTTL